MRIAESAQDLAGAVEIRASAFLRQFPALGQALKEVEEDDRRADTLLLIAERKLDRRVIGSMRLQPNVRQPLRLEREVLLPEPYKDGRLIEFMRLGVADGQMGWMVMAALAKAGYDIALRAGFDYVFAAGRSDIAPIYRSMGFNAVFGDEPIFLSYAQGRPHWIFALPLAEADRRWRESGRPLYRFMSIRHHPDIHLDRRRVEEAFGSRHLRWPEIETR